jgi:predicted exporter
MIKKPTLPQNKLLATAWLVFHAAIIIPCLYVIMTSHTVNFDADLFNMLPKPNIGKAMGVADERLTAMTGQNVFILVSHDDFNTAKETAENVYAQLKDNPGFASLSLYSDSSSLGQVTDFVHEYRWNLLDDKAVKELSTPEGARMFAQNSLAKAYSAFTFSSLNNLGEDPFMLGEYSLQNYLKSLQNSGTSMSPKDGVLATNYKGRWYVMIRGILSKEGAALASRSNGVAQIYSICNPLEKDGIRFVYTGTPFHSYKSSTSASREISIISVITMLAVILLLVIIFRSSLPIILSVLSIVLSIATSFSITYLLFGKIHILTLVFGTSLIGTCIDYSLHFFINWKANRLLSSGADVRKYLIRAMSVSIISTEICYFILVFAPFSLLKQMAVFSLFGLLSSFLTSTGFYPLLRIPEDSRRHIPFADKYTVPKWYNKKITGRIIISVLFAATITMLAVFHKNVKIQNNVNELYKPKGRVLADAAEAYKVLNYNPSGWFIITGNSAEETLEHEETLCRRLEKVNEGKPLGGYIATSQYIPSIARQKQSREAVKNLLPLAESQLEALGYDASTSAALKTAYNADSGKYISPDRAVPDYLRNAVSSEWLGEIDGKYYSIVLPVSITDENAYVQLANEDSNVYFENKMRDIGRDLDRLTKTILLLFAAAYVVIVVILKFFYNWKNTLKIASIPLLVVLVISSVFAASGIHLEFFSITGMILVFGLGLGYVIYMIENEKRQDPSTNGRLEPFAILLSFITTAVSFGALALSSFVPVHLLGLSIFLGLTTAFVCTML